MPAIAEGVGLPWDVPVADPVAAIAGARAVHGDTFVVDSGPDRYLFTFSPVGVASFYALPEEQASKGVADWRMLRRKVPDEVFADRRTLPHELFGREDVTTYLANVERALDATVVELGDAGEVDVFELTRRLGHRVGLASWGGPGSADGVRFDRLAAAFDVLDGAEAFVHPDAMAAVAASGHAAEHDALAEVTEELSATLDELPGVEGDHPCSPGSRRPGPAKRTPTGARASPTTSCSCTSPRCPTCSPRSDGRSSISSPIPTSPVGWPTGTARWPSGARSSRPAWPSARSWPATC